MSYPDLYQIAKVASQAATVARSAQQIATVAQTALSTGYQTGRSGYQYFYPSSSSSKRRMNGNGRNGNGGYRRGVFTATGKRATKAQVRAMVRADVQAARNVVPAFNQGFLRTGGYFGYSSNIGNELKFHDVDVNDGSVLVGGTILTGDAAGTINVIAQGNTESTRIGRKSVIKAINWRYTVTSPEVDAAGSFLDAETVRIILYLDKQCNGAAATILGILDTANYQSFNNLANKQRFRILMDRTVTLNYKCGASDGAGLVSSASVAVNGSFYKKCNIPIEFDNSASTGVLTSMRSNNLGVLSIARLGSISQIDSKFRLRFTDS